MLLRNRPHENESILPIASVITFSSGINLRPHPPSTRKWFAPAPTYPLTTLDNIWFVTGEAQSAKGRKHTHLPSKDFICKMNLSFIKRAPYSHFLRSLSSTFVVNENCFSEKWLLKRHSFRRNGVWMSLQVVSCELLGTSSGSMRRGSHRREIPGMG